jgi:site-specific DNA-cytosine methylase
MILTPREVEIRHFHLFCGLGGGAKGFNRGRARVGHVGARMRCVGGVDVDKAAIRDFDRLAGARGTVLDMFSREQYIAFHGQEPPDGWREATPDDIRRAAGYEQPHIGFGSAPCKGFSGLLSESRSTSAKYQALNQLALRGLWLALEAWKDDPLEFWLWENVPRIATRGRAVLDQMIRLLEAYGYVVAETTHDCGELGGLGQSRKRFLLVARHREKVPPFLYEPMKRPLRSVGDVIGRFPLPSDPAAGPMHRMRALQWRTWVRLAFVEAGSDWRSLKKLRIVNGKLADFGLMPETPWHNGALGVTPWKEPAGTVTSTARPHNGQFSVADPRPTYTGEYQQLGVNTWDRPIGAVSGQSAPGGGAYSVADPRIDSGRNDRCGVRGWDQPAHVVAGDSLPSNGAHAVADPRPEWDESRAALGVVTFEETAPTIIGVRAPGQGRYSVADPRLGDGPNGPHFNNVYRVVRFDQTSMAITAGTSPSSGGLAVADPRTGYPDARHLNVFHVSRFDQPTKTVTGADHVTGGALCVADPRTNIDRGRGDDYLTARHYGVLPWDGTAQAVTASADHDNGMWSVADPRPLPAPEARLVAVIRAHDGTWHRPFTTLELAALQSLVDPDEYLELFGTSDTAWRERIGNAVPPHAAEAVANVMAETLLLAWEGETFSLSAQPIWVQPIAIALAVDQPREGTVA